MSILLVDDERNITFDQVGYDFQPGDCIVRKYKEGVDQLRKQYWDVLLLDYKLSDYIEDEEEPLGIKEWTGFDVLLFLEDNREYLPGKIEPVTGSSIRKPEMQRVIDDLYSDFPVGYGEMTDIEPLFICLSCWRDHECPRRMEDDSWMLVLKSEAVRCKCTVCSTEGESITWPVSPF